MLAVRCARQFTSASRNEHLTASEQARVDRECAWSKQGDHAGQHHQFDVIEVREHHDKTNQSRHHCDDRCQEPQQQERGAGEDDDLNHPTGQHSCLVDQDARNQRTQQQQAKSGPAGGEGWK